MHNSIDEIGICRFEFHAGGIVFSGEHTKTEIPFLNKLPTHQQICSPLLTDSYG